MIRSMSTPKTEPTQGPGRPPNSPHGAAESNIVLRVVRKRKTAYVRAANGENKTLAAWMFKHCDKAAGYSEDPAKE